MPQVLNTPAFPVHAGTVQGIMASQSMADLPYDLLHANELGTVTVVFEGGTVVVDLGAGEDINIAGALTVSTTMVVKIS